MPVSSPSGSTSSAASVLAWIISLTHSATEIESRWISAFDGRRCLSDVRRVDDDDEDEEEDEEDAPFDDLCVRRRLLLPGLGRVSLLTGVGVGVGAGGCAAVVSMGAGGVTERRAMEGSERERLVLPTVTSPLLRCGIRLFFWRRFFLSDKLFHNPSGFLWVKNSIASAQKKQQGMVNYRFS